MAQNKIKNIIAIASGKGGVGKSTVAVNLALALSARGAKVGLLDADIYGPSQPSMVGKVSARPEIQDKKIMPIVAYNLKTMSIGYLVSIKASLSWRGPMLGKALEQLLNDTVWGELDYLIVDLPPGTGDVQLTLAKKANVTGAVIVTTPQDIALIDVRRAVEMFKTLNIPMLGVVENMSHFHCSNCGHDELIYGQGAADQLKQEYGLALLGQIPLLREIREETDSGCPPVVANSQSAQAMPFMAIADLVLAEIKKLPKRYDHLIPRVVIEHTDKKDK